MKKSGKRIASFLLSLLLCLTLLPVSSAQAAGDAMSLESVKELLNSVELHPQRTGYVEMDRLLEQILAPYAESDAYTKLKAMYDWTVENITYSWEGYSQDWAPAYDKFTLTYDLTYETGLPEAIPREVINRSYHALTAKKAVCYDWGALFAVMARYVGVESYVHTGILQIGTWTGHHGWTTLRIDGVNYIFDAQQDNRLLGIYGYNPHEHFGIAPASAGRWTPETAVNDARDEGFLPVTAERIRVADVTVKVSRSGQVEGAGIHTWGEPVTLTAVGDIPLVGWYNAGGNLLSEEPAYTFTPQGNVTVYALFEGDYFADIPANVWYLDDVCAAAEQGLIYGTTSVTFTPQGSMTRAMLAAILARADGADLSAYSDTPFADVNPEKWYAEAVGWAYENGVVYGVTETRFDPMGIVTREQAAAMLIRYLESRGVTVSEAPLDFTDADQISRYARESIAKAQSLEILAGYEDGAVRPRRTVTRAEGTALVMRMQRLAA